VFAKDLKQLTEDLQAAEDGAVVAQRYKDGYAVKVEVSRKLGQV